MVRNQKLWYWYNNTNTVLINLHGLAHETRLSKARVHWTCGRPLLPVPWASKAHLSAGPRANDTRRRKGNRKERDWLSPLPGHPQWCSSADCVQRWPCVYWLSVVLNVHSTGFLKHWLPEVLNACELNLDGKHVGAFEHHSTFFWIFSLVAILFPS